MTKPLIDVKLPEAFTREHERVLTVYLSGARQLGLNSLE